MNLLIYPLFCFNKRKNKELNLAPTEHFTKLLKLRSVVLEERRWLSSIAKPSQNMSSTILQVVSWARYLEVTRYQPLCAWRLDNMSSSFPLWVWLSHTPSGITWPDPLLTLLRAFQAKGLSGTDNLLRCPSWETDWVWTFCDQQFNLNHYTLPLSVKWD